MVDIRAKTTTGTFKDVLADRDGRLHTVEGGAGYIFTATGAGAISLKTRTQDVFPTRPWKLKTISATFSAAPAASESLTVTQNPGGKYKNRPSTVLFSTNPSVTSATSILNMWEDGGKKMQSGDEVTLAFTNTDVGTVTVEIEVEAL